VGATGFENAGSDSANCGAMSPSEFFDGKMGEGDQAGEVEDVEKWVPCAPKGTGEDRKEAPITRALWDALASWSRNFDPDDLRRLLIAIIKLVG
jgi:hypothetical protein